MLSEKDTCKYRDLRPMEKNMNAYMEANYGIQIQNTESSVFKHQMPYLAKSDIKLNKREKK